MRLCFYLIGIVICLVCADPKLKKTNQQNQLIKIQVPQQFLHHFYGGGENYVPFLSGAVQNDTTAPTYGLGSQVYGPANSNLVQGTSNFVPANPNYATGSPNYVPVPNSYGPGSPNYVQGTPNYNAGSGNFGLGIHRPVLNPFFHQIYIPAGYRPEHSNLFNQQNQGGARQEETPDYADGSGDIAEEETAEEEQDQVVNEEENAETESEEGNVEEEIFDYPTEEEVVEEPVEEVTDAVVIEGEETASEETVEEETVEEETATEEAAVDEGIADEEVVEEEVAEEVTESTVQDEETQEQGEEEDLFSNFDDDFFNDDFFSFNGDQTNSDHEEFDHSGDEHFDGEETNETDAADDTNEVQATNIAFKKERSTSRNFLPNQFNWAGNIVNPVSNILKSNPFGSLPHPFQGLFKQKGKKSGIKTFPDKINVKKPVKQHNHQNNDVYQYPQFPTTSSGLKNSFSADHQDKLIKGGSHLTPGIQTNTFFGIFDFFNKDKEEKPEPPEKPEPVVPEKPEPPQMPEMPETPNKKDPFDDFGDFNMKDFDFDFEARKAKAQSNPDGLRFESQDYEKVPAFYLGNPEPSPQRNYYQNLNALGAESSFNEESASSVGSFSGWSTVNKPGNLPSPDWSDDLFNKDMPSHDWSINSTSDGNPSSVRKPSKKPNPESKPSNEWSTGKFSSDVSLPDWPVVNSPDPLPSASRKPPVVSSPDSLPDTDLSNNNNPIDKPYSDWSDKRKPSFDWSNIRKPVKKPASDWSSGRKPNQKPVSDWSSERKPSFDWMSGGLPSTGWSAVGLPQIVKKPTKPTITWRDEPDEDGFIKVREGFDDLIEQGYQPVATIPIRGTDGYITKDLNFDFYDYLGFYKEENFEDPSSISF